MPIPEDTIRRVRESTDIVEVVSEYVSLQRRGGANYFGVCPFHEEKTPSFSVHATRQTFHCFGCGEGGNVFTFLMKIEGVEFPDAVRRLAARAGISIEEERGQQSATEALYQANDLALKFYHYRLTQTETPDVLFARDYLKKRGIDDSLVEKFKLGLAPEAWDELLNVSRRRKIGPDVLEKAGLARRSEGGKVYDWFRGRLMFPIFNPSGRPVAFGGRILRDDPQRPQPKYINTSDTAIYHKGKLLYGIPQARDAMRQEGTAILVEGYTDLIALHRAGFTHAIAGLGTALTHDQALLIKRFAGKVVMLYDADTAGNMAAFRGADILLGAGLEVHVALLPVGEDPDTLIQKGGREAMEPVFAAAEPLVDFKINFFKRQGGLDSPQQRSEATHALLETIRRISDPITRQFALHDAAEKLGVDERTLASELNRVRHTTAQASNARMPSTAPMDYFEEMLLNLFWVLVQYPERRSEIFNFFHSSDLGDHPLKPAFTRIESAHIEGEEIAEADLYDALGNMPDMVRRIGRILNRPAPDDPRYVDTIVNDAPAMLRRHGIKNELAVLKEEMKHGGGPEVMKRFQELKLELKELESRNSEW